MNDKVRNLFSQAGNDNPETPPTIPIPPHPKDIKRQDFIRETSLKETILKHNRTRQELEDFRYNRFNTMLINRAYKSVIKLLFKPLCCKKFPAWVFLLGLLVLCYIVGHIDEQSEMQSIANAISDVLIFFFLFMLAIPSAKGIRRLFSRFTDKML